MLSHWLENPIKSEYDPVSWKSLYILPSRNAELSEVTVGLNQALAMQMLCDILLTADFDRDCSCSVCMSTALIAYSACTFTFPVL